MSENQPKDELIGKSLGQYEIGEEIGRGGMATVYKARQRSMNRIVAIKVLPRHLLHDPTFMERFEREVEVISHLEHPHILPIYDYGQGEGLPYIAMRFLGGGSLEDYIRRRGPMPVDEMEKPLRQIAQALDYAHAQGVVHRDLKPGNIMLDEGGNAYLSDFGIARVMGSEMTGSMIIGTPSYMSPEQANGLPIDARSDVYALGVVLFELITGRLPFQAETPMAVLLKHINEDVPPIADFRDDVSKVVEDVVRKATAKDPDDRYSSAGEMTKAFSAALRDETATFDKPTERRAIPRTPDTAGTIPAIEAEAVMAASRQMQADPNATVLPTPTSTGTAPSVGSGGNRRLLGGLAAVVVLALAAVAAFLGLANGDDNNTVTPPIVDAVPTAFPLADTFEGDQFTISMPREWLSTEFFPPQNTRLQSVHAWADRGGDAFITLMMIEAELSGDDAFYRDAVNDYVANQYNRFVLQGQLTFVDEAVAEDGTIRRSYRIIPLGQNNDEDDDDGPQDNNNRPGPDFLPIRAEPGQLDVFFVQEAPYLVVVQMYTADSTGNRLVNRLQSVLDSLRVTPGV